MLSINTNLSSLIAQNSMQTSTNKLNQAIERLTTGFKINHAKDNAANYSIITNMNTKMSSCMIAQDNIAMGLDMVTTAGDTISQMQDHAMRIRSLLIQSRNNTYGEESLKAIQAEATARLAEITRLYNTTQYNGISLFNGENNNTDMFINNPKTYDNSVVNAMNSITTFTNGSNGEYKITSAEDLAYLAEIVNDKDWDTSNATFVLANDIDLTAWCATNGNWEPIGYDYSHSFEGTFDGNGHVISNLKINNPTADYQGLFGYIVGADIKNIGIENVNIIGQSYTGGLVGNLQSNSRVTNSFTTGIVKGTGYLGGLIGSPGSDTCYIESCYSEADVVGTGGYVGGIAGLFSYGSLTNCYATGNVSSNNDSVGGLVGSLMGGSITNSYATGNVSGYSTVGGLVGYSSGSIINSYATGDVNGHNVVAGLVGNVNRSSIINCYALGNVTGTGFNIRGFLGAGSDSYIHSCGSVVSDSLVTTLTQEQVESISKGVLPSVSTPVPTNTVDPIPTGWVPTTPAPTTPVPTSTVTPTGTSVPTPTTTVTPTGTSTPTGTPTPTSTSTPTPTPTPTSIVISTPFGTVNVPTGTSVVPTPKFNATNTGSGVNLQVGIQGNKHSQINFGTGFRLNLPDEDFDVTSDEALNTIDNFIATLNEKQTELGAVTNRLESALDEITIQYENLASSRSTIRDADMAELSSTYIQQQILQEASATLLATTKNIQYQNVLGLLQGLRG